jgi:4-hydroxy-tetrahydrodipicolinate synthase
MFKGSYVALVTPFKNGKVDASRLKWLVDFQIEQGTEGLVPCGSTGESATLSHEEHKHVIEVVIKAARGRVPVMAGAGSNSTLEALDLVRHAARAGANGALLVVPYYNKPTPAGLFEHFRQIARATKLPLILYNIPGRTGINMPVDTVVRLASTCPTIIGIKEASGTMDYTSELLSRLGKDRFIVLSGDDSLTLPLLSLGARGVISVLANILPGPMSELCSSWENGNSERALELHLELYPLMRALFVETNPIPIKAAMAKLGICREELRLPLVPMSADARKKLWAALEACPLLGRRKSGGY